MTISLSLIHVLFSIVSILFSVAFTTQYLEGEAHWINGAVGLLGGSILAGLLIGMDRLLRKCNLRSFTTAILGLFFGCLLAKVVLFGLSGMLQFDVDTASFMPLRFFAYLLCSYAGLVITTQSAEEIQFSIPFVEFKQVGHKKKDILVDVSIFSDSRIIDLASSGLLDHHLIIPRFAVKELYTQSESTDEICKLKARRSLELIRKLENLPSLDLRYVDTDFPEITDPMMKLVRLARFMDTHIITSDINRIQQASVEGVRIINIHMLSNALKPITQAGEAINIKIQRYGKEARQGVGYLEDGTMVVVNGGAEFIGETIKSYVLSVKHTSSGRMIFCNAADDESLQSEPDEYSSKRTDEMKDQRNFADV